MQLANNLFAESRFKDMRLKGKLPKLIPADGESGTLLLLLLGIIFQSVATNVRFLKQNLHEKYTTLFLTFTMNFKSAERNILKCPICILNYPFASEDANSSVCFTRGAGHPQMPAGVSTAVLTLTDTIYSNLTSDSGFLPYSYGSTFSKPGLG